MRRENLGEHQRAIGRPRRFGFDRRDTRAQAPADTRPAADSRRIPTTMNCSAPACTAASARMPASLRPPINTSFGHLISAGNPVTARTASRNRDAARERQQAQRDSRRSSISVAGRTITDTYKPAPGGENQTRPCRPRPAVCISATTVVPSSAPASARRAATSLVEAVDSSQCTRRPIEPARCRHTRDSPRDVGRNVLLAAVSAIVRQVRFQS